MIVPKSATVKKAPQPPSTSTDYAAATPPSAQALPVAAMEATHAEKITKAIQSHDQNMRQERQQLLRSYPYAKLERTHLRGAQLLPSRYDMLDELPRNGVVCEIGVANGDFSAEILNRCQPAKLHLVDPWKAERYRSGRQKVCERFANKIEDGTVSVHVGYSTARLPEFPDHCFDWVYIDSVHDYRTTAQELVICLNKVKPGGIIAGHDYTAGNLVVPRCYGVVQAVQEFCVKYRWKYLYLTCESHGYASFAVQA